MVSEITLKVPSRKDKGSYIRAGRQTGLYTGKHMVNYERQSEDVKSKSNHTGISKYMGSRSRGKARRKIYEIKAMRDTGPKAERRTKRKV